MTHVMEREGRPAPADAGWLRSDLAHRLRWAVRDRAPRLGFGRAGFDLDAYRALFELRRWRPNDVMVDVGANDGRTIRRLRRFLPPTRILAFEPVSETFARLEAAVGGWPGVALRKMALGDVEEECDIHLGPLSALDSFHAGAQTSDRRERVAVTTLDAVLDREAIDRVNFLKIDAEGHDLAVLQGAEGALRGGRIDIVQVEAGFGAPDVVQPDLAEIQNHLRDRGFHLWAVVNPCRGPALARRRGQPSVNVLTYCDALFVHEDADVRPRCLADI